VNQRLKKVLGICIVIFVAAYFVHSMVINYERAAYYQQQAIRAQQRKQAMAKAKPKTTAPAPKTPAVPPAAPSVARRSAPRVLPKPAPPSPFAKISGIWRGGAALDGRGICNLKFELNEQAEGRFTGYSTMTCTATGPLMADKKINQRASALNRMDPEAAILTGAVEKGSIEFHVDKTVGADAQGCSPTSFSLTPFGANQLAAEWQEATCAGGHMILRKVRQ
jgi:hypothetical protein